MVSSTMSVGDGFGFCNGDKTLVRTVPLHRSRANCRKRTVPVPGASYNCRAARSSSRETDRGGFVPVPSSNSSVVRVSMFAFPVPSSSTSSSASTCLRTLPSRALSCRSTAAAGLDEWPGVEGRMRDEWPGVECRMRDGLDEWPGVEGKMRDDIDGDRGVGFW